MTFKAALVWWESCCGVAKMLIVEILVSLAVRGRRQYGLRQGWRRRSEGGGRGSRYSPGEVVISENGVDVPGESGRGLPEVLKDGFRIDYYKNYVQAAQDSGVRLLSITRILEFLGYWLVCCIQ